MIVFMVTIHGFHLLWWLHGFLYSKTHLTPMTVKQEIKSQPLCELIAWIVAWNKPRNDNFCGYHLWCLWFPSWCLLFPLWFPASFWVACLDCGLKLAWKWQLLWLPVVSMVETTSWFPFQSNLTAKSCDHPNQPIRSLHSLKSPRKLQNLWDFMRFHPKFYSHLKSKAVRTALLKIYASLLLIGSNGIIWIKALED